MAFRTFQILLSSRFSSFLFSSLYWVSTEYPTSLPITNTDIAPTKDDDDDGKQRSGKLNRRFIFKCFGPHRLMLQSKHRQKKLLWSSEISFLVSHLYFIHFSQSLSCSFLPNYFFFIHKNIKKLIGFFFTVFPFHKLFPHLHKFYISLFCAAYLLLFLVA